MTHCDHKITSHGRDIILLRCNGYSEGTMHWMSFHPEFREITVEEWESSLWKDPRDLPWFLVASDDGKEIPFCEFSVTSNLVENEILFKYIGSYHRFSDVPPGVSSTDYATRAQERAPFSWEKRNPVLLNKMLRSGQKELISEALMDMNCHCITLDPQWANGIFLQYATNPEASIRLWAISGLGELARVCGYADRSSALPILTAALSDQSKGVRMAATKSIEEINRFTP